MATLPTPEQIQLAILSAFRHLKADIRPGEIVNVISIQLLLHEVGVTAEEFAVELSYLVEAGEIEYKPGGKFAKLTGKGFARMPDDDG